MPKQHHTGNSHADQIIKILDKNTSSGYRPDDVFSDWLELIEASLKALPAQAISVASTGQLVEDTPETAALFERLRKRYPRREHFERFSQALAVLLESVTPDDPQDILGDIYMTYGYPNTWAGQFFTPMSIARLMAMISMGDIESQINERIKSAIEQSPLAQAALFTSLVINDPTEARNWYVNRIIPYCYEFIKPITVCDPCCGSGVMFLAASACIPAWARPLGLVQFYGMDIDQGCVRMASINCMIYGLNGWSMKWALALKELELKALSDPHRQAYAEAQAAHAADDEARVQQIAHELRTGQYQQATLF